MSGDEKFRNFDDRHVTSPLQNCLQNLTSTPRPRLEIILPASLTRPEPSFFHAVVTHPVAKVVLALLAPIIVASRAEESQTPPRALQRRQVGRIPQGGAPCLTCRQSKELGLRLGEGAARWSIYSNIHAHTTRRALRSSRAHFASVSGQEPQGSPLRAP